MPTSQVIKDLLSNGAHFGHPTNKWNPKMEKFIFGEKSGIYIIDLEKTEQALKKACDHVRALAAENKTVLFAGTKRQAKDIVRQEAERCGMFYVDERWLGGCLTNFQTIRKSVEKLDDIQKMKEGEIYDSLAKKEQAKIDRMENKLLRNLGGIRKMKALPDCVIIVDTVAEMIAVKESRKRGIPIVAILDTNSDPDDIDLPVPANDDAIRSIRYILSSLADAIIEGGGGVLEMKVEEKKAPEEKPEQEEKTSSETEATGQEESAKEITPDEKAAEEVASEEEPVEELKKESASAEDAESSASEESEDESLEEEGASEEEEEEKKRKELEEAASEVEEGDIKLD